MTELLLYLADSMPICVVIDHAKLESLGKYKRIHMYKNKFTTCFNSVDVKCVYSN